MIIRVAPQCPGIWGLRTIGGEELPTNKSGLKKNHEKDPGY